MRLRTVLLTLICFALSACYEGTGRSTPGGGTGGSGGKDGGGGGGKTYGLALLDIIRPSNRILSDPCSGIPFSLVELRTAEIQARIGALTAQIDAQADNLRVNVDEIQNCGDFSMIEARAANPLPDPQVSDAEKAKLALHIRLAIWFANGSDGGAYPSSAVTNTEWADMSHLGSLGYTRRLSLNYFAVLNDGYGYLATWQANSDSSYSFTAQVLDNPVPTDDGVQKILNSVQQSSASFADWLTQRAQGL